MEEVEIPEHGPAKPEASMPEDSQSESQEESEQEEGPQRRDAACPVCFLQPGARFRGTQKVPRGEDAWIVSVGIQGYDAQRGYVCGSMEAQNLPTSDETVVTFWEGEIIDNRNFTFYTGRWDATHSSDIEHWSKFP